MTDSSHHIIPEQLLIATDDSVVQNVATILFIAYYGMHFHADPLRQHATDFMYLVNIKALTPVLIPNSLLTLYDMEFLQLQKITDSEKVYMFFVYIKLLHCGKEGYMKN